LRFPLNILPMVVSGIVEARVSAKRLNKFLLNEVISGNARGVIKLGIGSRGGFE
jgi:hypothetical protein